MYNVHPLQKIKLFHIHIKFLKVATIRQYSYKICLTRKSVFYIQVFVQKEKKNVTFTRDAICHHHFLRVFLLDF